MNGAEPGQLLFWGQKQGKSTFVTFVSTAGVAALVGCNDEARSTAIFMLVDTSGGDDGDTVGAGDDIPGGSINLDDDVFPCCQAAMRITSGTCLYSDQGPAANSGNSDSAATVTATAASALDTAAAAAQVAM